MNQALEIWNYFVLVYFIGLNGVYIVLIVIAYFSINRYLNASELLDTKKLFRNSSLLKPVSIIAPAYNEGATVVINIRSLMMLNYPNFEIILVNDGSTDNTLKKVIEAYDMRPVSKAAFGHIPTQEIKGIYRSGQHPNFTLVDKVNGGKADALNAGINLSRNPLIATIDTDSLLEKDVLTKLARPFVEHPETVAVGGVVRIVNGCKVKAENLEEIRLPKKITPLFQVVEYFRAFFFGRVGWESLNMLLIISGAIGMFRKADLLAIGGYYTETVGEDMDLVLRLHKHLRDQKKKYKISFIAEPVCWTEAPDNLKVLSRQRNRWQRGLLESLFNNKEMLFNRKYGRIGLVAMPFALFVEGLGPLVEVIGLFTISYSYYLGNLDLSFAMAFFSVAVLLGVVMSTSALIIEEITFRRYPSTKNVLVLFLVGIVENFGYRQLNSWWRLKAIVDFWRGKKSWGEMPRQGFVGEENQTRLIDSTKIERPTLEESKKNEPSKD